MPHATTFHFTGTLSTEKGALMPFVVYLPKKIVDTLPPGRLRTKGTINGVPFALAPQYRKDGRRFFSINASLRKQAKIDVGSKVDIIFQLVDPGKIDVPKELKAVLAQDDVAMSIWNTFASGLKRSLIHYITSVKNVDSRINRAIKMMEKAKMGLLHSQKNKAKPNPAQKKSDRD